VIRRVFDIYVEQAPVLMPAAAVVFVFSGIVAGLLVEAGAGPALLGELIALIAITLFTGMVVELVADVRDGRRDASVGQLLRALAPVLGQLFVVGLVVAVVVIIGLFLLIVPGLILLTVWWVAAPVVVLERPDGLKALGRSRELVTGNAWQVFGVVLLLLIALAALTFGLTIAAESAGTAAGIVVRVVVGVLTAPFASLAQAVVYFDLRDLREPRPAAGGPAYAEPETEPAGPEPGETPGEPPRAGPEPGEPPAATADPGEPPGSA
jgi:hypothetical protein